MEKTDRFADEERIDTFMAEHRPIVEDPEAGEASLRRVVVAASEEYQHFSKEQVAAANRAADAAKELAAAVENPGTPASAVLALEKRYAKEKAEHERVKALGERLLAFFDEADARYRERERITIPATVQDALDKQDRRAAMVTPKEPGFFRRLFGR